jgi:YVTN family beta-propeller protein
MAGSSKTGETNWIKKVSGILLTVALNVYKISIRQQSIVRKAKSKLVLFLIVSIQILVIANTVQAVEIIASIPLNIGTAIAYDSNKGEVWVTNFVFYVNELGMNVSEPSNSVSAISDSDYTMLATVAVGEFPSSIAYDSALHEIFVANQGSGTVSVISTTSYSVVATIDLNTNSSHGGQSNIVYDSGKGEMFVGNYASGVVSVISDSTRQVVANIPLGNDPYPTGLIYDSGKGEIFVSYKGLPGRNPADFISVISDSSNSVVSTVPLDNIVAPLGAYDPATNEVFMPSPGNDSILVISDETQ